MKKVICITIALCLVFASVLPVYAEAWTSQQASSVTQNLSALVLAFTGSVGTMYNSVSEMMSWLTPSGSFSSSHSITGVTLYEIVDYIAWTLSGVGPTVYQTLQDTCSSIVNSESLISAFKTQSNSNLSKLIYSLTNQLYGVSGRALTQSEMMNNAHQYLLYYDSNLGYRDGRYALASISDNGISNENGSFSYWQYGSPLGNIALLLRRGLQNDALIYSYRWVADLKHYNDNLTTWDSQGNTLTQVGFTPESAIQGIYRYLAFTQRDVARLAYVFANDEELEARELAQANQEQVLDDFIDPNGSGSVSPTDLGNMTDASDGFKSNFSTNVGSSHIWDVFDNSRYNWFTQQTKNQLDTTQQTRNTKAVNNDYPTPLLDNYYNEIFGIIGVDIND